MKPIAIIYRVGAAVKFPSLRCKQYPFYFIDVLETFCSRKPYVNEKLRVLVIKNDKVISDFIADANLVVKLYREAV